MPDFVARWCGLCVELEQEWDGSSSAWSPEDLPSNDAGIDYAGYLNGEESRAVSFARWAVDNGAQFGVEVTQTAEYKAMPDGSKASKDGGARESTSTAEPLFFIREKKEKKE